MTPDALHALIADLARAEGRQWEHDPLHLYRRDTIAAMNAASAALLQMAQERDELIGPASEAVTQAQWAIAQRTRAEKVEAERDRLQAQLLAAQQVIERVREWSDNGQVGCITHNVLAMRWCESCRQALDDKDHVANLLPPSGAEGG